LKKKILLCLALAIVLTSVLACAAPQASQLADKTWLSPGKIRIDDLRSGNKVEQKIKVHNGSELSTDLSVYYRIPDYTENGYSTAPAGARDWIRIAQYSPVLAPRETREIAIVLDLPEQAQTPERWEFWIGVKATKNNTLATELCSRWLVTMK
jgi:hypothetical protein